MAWCVLRGHHVTRCVMANPEIDLYFLHGYRCLVCRLDFLI